MFNITAFKFLYLYRVKLQTPLTAISKTRYSRRCFIDMYHHLLNDAGIISISFRRGYLFNTTVYGVFNELDRQITTVRFQYVQKVTYTNITNRSRIFLSNVNIVFHFIDVWEKMPKSFRLKNTKIK